MKEVSRALGCLLCAAAASIVLGCSKRQSGEGTPSAAAAASICERHLLAISDVGGILELPITQIRPLPGDTQSCELATDHYPALVISVRPGVGRTTVDTWQTGKMSMNSAPLAGVGDAAVWQPAIRELVAEKDGVLCDIQVRGTAADLAVSAQALPGALGRVCNKVFDAYRREREAGS